MMCVTVESPIKDTIEITSIQRTMFNVPNGDFPIVLILLFLTLIKDYLSTKDKMAIKQWVPNVSVIRRFHCIFDLCMLLCASFMGLMAVGWGKRL